MPRTLESLLREHQFFTGLDSEYLALLAGCARNVVFPAGSFLFREGQSADTFYLIREGRVAMEIAAPGRDPLIVQTLGNDEVVGFSWLLWPHRWELDGRAIERVRAIEMDGACMRGKCEADSRLGFELMRRFATLATDRLRAARLQLLDVYGRAGSR